MPWRKSTRSGDEGNCVELANFGAIRDSKNPTATPLPADLPTLLAAIKSGHLSNAAPGLL